LITARGSGVRFSKDLKLDILFASIEKVTLVKDALHAVWKLASGQVEQTECSAAQKMTTRVRQREVDEGHVAHQTLSSLALSAQVSPGVLKR
jgi:predicted RNA-binding protein associated with RNAse of E/G family